MTPVKFHEAAELEAAEAIAYYEGEGAGLGTALRNELEAAIEKIVIHPFGYQVIYRSNVRRALTRRFPYSLIFTIEEHFVFIVAVFHSSRDPMVWKGRIG